MSQSGNPNQTNSVNKGNLYATQGGNMNFNTTNNNTTNNSTTHLYGPTAKGGLRTDTKVLLMALPIDVLFFFYGMLSYTGRNTTGDEWRAVTFLFLFLFTCGLFGRWVRRRI